MLIKGSSRGGDITPTSKYTEAGKTINKILISLNDVINTSEQVNLDQKIFNKIYEYISTNEESIINDITQKVESISLKKGESFIITITLFDDVNEKYMGDFGLIKNRLAKIQNEQYYKKYGKTSKGKGICYYCKEDGEVYGFVNTYNSYTVDKIGFVSGGFKQENAWRNYPVCAGCAQNLEMGKKYVKENLTSRFSGFNYFVVPKAVIRDLEDEEEFIKTLHEFERNEKFSTKEITKQNLLGSEKEFLEIIQDSKNFLNTIWLFLKKNSQEVFLEYFTLKTLFKVKNILRVKDQVMK